MWEHKESFQEEHVDTKTSSSERSYGQTKILKTSFEGRREGTNYTERSLGEREN